MRSGALPLLVSLLIPAAAQASIFDLYGFAARGAGLGNALTAGADDYTATYYNPAALTVRKSPRVGIGLDLVLPGPWVDTDRPDPEPAPRTPRWNLGLHGGALLPLSSWTGGRLAFGLGLFHPLLEFTRVDAFDPVRPQLYLYQSLPDKLLLAPAFGFEIAPWLSVGAGLQVLASIAGRADTGVSLGSGRFTRRRLGVDLIGESSPTAGVLLSPRPGLRLGVSWRSALDFAYELPVLVAIEELGTLSFELSGTVLYTPHQLSAGAAWRLDERLLLVADLTWAMWSLAPDPSARVTVRLQGEAVGHDELIRVDSLPVSLGARDVLVPRLGAEYALRPTVTLRGGYSYRPTPLPTPTGRSNYVDSNAHTLSAGVAWTGGVGLEATAQLTWLTSRRIDKQDPDDTVGSYNAGGPLGHLSVSVIHDL